MSKKTAQDQTTIGKQNKKSTLPEDHTGLRKNVAPHAGGPIAPGHAATTGPETVHKQHASKTARILAIDIGGTGLKAAMLDFQGKMTSERVRVDTPYPCSPERMIDTLVALCEPLGDFDFLSIGFPGVVRDGRVITAPHFDDIDPDDPFAAGIMQDTDKDENKGKDDRALKTAGKKDGNATAWRGFSIGPAVAEALARQRGAPTRPVQLINDAEMQGLAAIRGRGLELVLTLGTGAGSALFRDGQLMPHLELAHHPIRGRKSYNAYVGDRARRKLGKKKWNQHVRRTIAILDSLLHFDHLYIGGGNAQHIDFPLPGTITLVSNDAGIEGGAMLWRNVEI
ncbi:ROK family protein [Robbsia andropogonis]|uniref:ROK family protein n=1 Tax=Robbsia andropogonis TaxID=28092 RepID=UPI000465C864|nr:ROK family protein [Robbsia andropogonis]MCP1117442.1 ROK family protein [Robbsia andropogonis]MCP1126908.1 ROK family protein [Robbsia andropogonis]